MSEGSKQGKDRSAKVRPCVALLSLYGPEPLGWHLASVWSVPRKTILLPLAPCPIDGRQIGHLDVLGIQKLLPRGRAS